MANVLTELGVEQGDRVAIYLPMIPEAIASMLAVARIGAVHSVVFGGFFSADSLRARIDDAGAKIVITADGGWRKGKVSPLKPAVDQALADRNGSGIQETVEHVLVVERGGNEVEWTADRDIWWHDVVPQASSDHEGRPSPPRRPSSSCTPPARPVSRRASSTPPAATSHRRPSRTASSTMCTPRPTSTGARPTSAGSPATPTSPTALWPTARRSCCTRAPRTPRTRTLGELIEKHGVTIFYTAPTAIRSFMKIGRDVPQKFDLSSLRLLGSVGEPINPEAWMWYRDIIGADEAPIVDTWWQTETGAIMISARSRGHRDQARLGAGPRSGISIAVVDDQGEPVGNGSGGLLVVTEPWPSMLRGIWGDPDRYRETYWEKFADKGTTSPVTAPASTTTATCGSSAASTTS